MRGLQVNEAVSVGTLARPGDTQSINISVSAPPWLRNTEEALPCLDADPELFFPHMYNLTCKDQIEEAKQICASCPMREACLDWAVERTDLDGLWAGTTPMDRRRIRTGKADSPWRAVLKAGGAA
jgi:WhiB family redox-sensing transcriptional regulator